MQKSLKKNMLMSIVLTSSNFIFPIITYSYVARVLTPVGTGKVAFASSILGYFSYIATLGVPSYGLRECAKNRDNKDRLSTLVQELLLISIVATIICYIALFISVFTVPKLYSYKDLFIIMSTSLLLNTIGVEWFYQAIEEYTYITIRSLCFKCCSVVLTFILIHSEEDYLWYGLLTVFTSSANYLLNFFHLRKFISFKKKEVYNIKKHLKPILILFSSAIILTVYNNFDVSMIGFINTEREVGLYNSALKIKNIILSLSSALTAVLIPRISYYIQRGDNNNFQKLLLKSARISLLLAIPIAIYVIVFNQEVLLLIAGREYLGASHTLQILILCIIPLVITNLFGNQILIPSGNEKRYSQSVFIGLIINIILNLILIPIIGASGAAIGTLSTECWNVYWMSKDEKKIRNNLISNLKISIYLLALGISIIISYTIYKIYLTSFPNLCILICTSFCYFVIYYFLLLLQREPILLELLSYIKCR